MSCALDCLIERIVGVPTCTKVLPPPGLPCIPLQPGIEIADAPSRSQLARVGGIVAFDVFGGEVREASESMRYIKV